MPSTHNDDDDAHLLLADVEHERRQRAPQRRLGPGGVERVEQAPLELQRDAELVDHVQLARALGVRVLPVVVRRSHHHLRR